VVLGYGVDTFFLIWQMKASRPIAFDTMNPFLMCFLSSISRLSYKPRRAEVFVGGRDNVVLELSSVVPPRPLVILMRWDLRRSFLHKLGMGFLVEKLGML